MIQANELRIGNYVSDIHASNLFYASVNKIECSRCYYGSFHSAYSDLKQIPLTEEWLLKFGFIDNNYSFDLKAGRKNISFGWSSRIVSSGIRNGFSSRKYRHIKHVHQLQNLYFALTGQELTI